MPDFRFIVLFNNYVSVDTLKLKISEKAADSEEDIPGMKERGRGRESKVSKI